MRDFLKGMRSVPALFPEERKKRSIDLTNYSSAEATKNDWEHIGQDFIMLHLKLIENVHVRIKVWPIIIRMN
jgi:hypothetical protein